MKQRNLLLALALLLLFIAPGVIYFHKYAEHKPFGIILFVGEGLVTEKLTAARLYDGGADRRLAIQSLPHLALLSTDAADLAVPDAAAAASALACGAKVNVRALSTDPSGKARRTLLEIAHHRGRATGLVTNGRLTDPTPAAFYAHAGDCRDRLPLAVQLADGAFVDVVLGGGRADFQPESKGGQRRDTRDLVAEMSGNGYAVAPADGDLAAVQLWSSNRLLGLFAGGPLAFRDQPGAGVTSDGHHPAPSLAEMVRTAVETLQRRAGGYLLVVDAGLIGKASQLNDSEHVLREIVELDHALAVALQYADPKTLVLVAGGEATGGMSLNGYPLRQDHGISLLGMNASGLPSLTWATGPAGPSANGARTPPPAPAAVYAATAANVADDAVAAGSGPGSERLHGFMDNTFIFDLVNSQL